MWLNNIFLVLKNIKNKLKTFLLKITKQKEYYLIKNFIQNLLLYIKKNKQIQKETSDIFVQNNNKYCKKTKYIK